MNYVFAFEIRSKVGDKVEKTEASITISWLIIFYKYIFKNREKSYNKYISNVKKYKNI